MTVGGRTPWWVWALGAVLACTEPVMHIWIASFPPPNAVPTGLRAHDSVIYLQSMKAVESGCEMPFAGVESSRGDQDPRYFVVPNFMLYAALGALAHALHVDHFLFLGFANGLGAFLYLIAVFRFLEEASPRYARAAFALFALGGGLGGVSYLFTGILGLHDVHLFDEYFRRFALYELIEGPHLLPFLHFQRIYYTVSLACCYAGLALFLRYERQGRRFAWPACLLLAAGTFINMRYGPLAWSILALCLIDRPGAPRLRAELAGIALGGVLLGLAAAVTAHYAHPRLLENAYHTVRQAMWLSPFVCAAALHSITVPQRVVFALARSRGLPRALGFAACGYLAAFAALFLAYQVYYGNLLIARDAAAALAISDWALAGGLLGAGAAFLFRRFSAEAGARPPQSWVSLWLLLFTAGAVSAFAQGRFLGFSPQRLMVFLWLPLCLLSAETLTDWGTRRRIPCALTSAAFAVAGVSSILVSALFFHGPVGRVPGKGPFARLHTEIMSSADAELLDAVRPGRVLAPMPFGDIASLRPGVGAVHGVGALQADIAYLETEQAVSRFFSADGDDAFRRRFVRERRVDYVYCPDTFPVDEAVVRRLRAARWLRVAAEGGRGVLFQVVRHGEDHGGSLSASL